MRWYHAALVLHRRIRSNTDLKIEYHDETDTWKICAVFPDGTVKRDRADPDMIPLERQ